MCTNGPYPCGRNSDLRIFKRCMKQALLPGETVIADGAYRDPKCEKNARTGDMSRGGFHGTVRAMHETSYRRLKQFDLLSQRFRHNRRVHSVCFRAVASLTQLTIRNVHPLFGVKK